MQSGLARWWCAVPALALAVAACASEPGEDADPDDGAPLAFAISVPPVDLGAGAERTVCFYTTVTVPAGTAVLRWESDLSSGAHGLQVFATSTELAADGTLTDVCRYAEPGGAPPRLLYTANLSRDAAAMPAGVAMPLPAQVWLVVRLHLVNPGDQPVQAAGDVRARAVPDGEAYVAAATLSSYRTTYASRPATCSPSRARARSPPGSTCTGCRR
jgi:hypothetical protein